LAKGSSRVRRPKSTSRGGDPTMSFSSGQPLLITVPMNAIGLCVSHSASGGGFQPGATEQAAAASPAGITRTSIHNGSAAISRFMECPSPVPSGSGSVRPHRAFYGRAQHQPPLGRGKVRARVRGAAVVPEEQIAEPPDVLVDKLALLGVVEHR